MTNRYAQCDDTCTVDCGACKGAGRPESDDCPTCQGRMWNVRHGKWVATRETVGMACQTCGKDYAAPTADVTREPTGGQGLLDELVRITLDWSWEPGIEPTDAQRQILRDTFRLLPELAALIADADRWRQATIGDPTEPLPLAMQARDLLVRVRELEATVADAERRGYERGRRSVGLGDLLPEPCGEEERAPNYHFVESYGEWLPCTRRSGHDGDHEHEDSGFTWPLALDGEPQP